MRELKFRVWDGEKFLRSSFGKKDAEFISLKIEGGILPQYGGLINYHKTMVVQQYTGMKDRNGKEIYEGDIVKCFATLNKNYDENLKEQKRRCFNNVVDYWCGNLGVGFRLKGTHYQVMLKKHHVYNFDMEVIGNIYENPELLNIKG